MAVQTVEIPFPLKGVSEASSYGKQPEGTTPDALNVRGYDPRTGRARGAQRSGTVKHLTGVIDETNEYPIQEIVQTVATDMETVYNERGSASLIWDSSDIATPITHDQINAVAFDVDGNIYIAGNRLGTGTTASVWKLDKDGGETWVYDTGGHAHAIAVEPDVSNPRVYIAGVHNSSYTGGSAKVRSVTDLF